MLDRQLKLCKTFSGLRIILRLLNRALNFAQNVN